MKKNVEVAPVKAAAVYFSFATFAILYVKKKEIINSVKKYKANIDNHIIIVIKICIFMLFLRIFQL